MSRVLVIEDSPAVALLLRRRLVMAGHSVEVSATGLSALDRMAPANLPDVVLADMMMPGIDGVETARRIKSHFPELPVILVTGQDHGLLPGDDVDAIFSKPIDFDGLLSAVGRLAEGSPAVE